MALVLPSQLTSPLAGPVSVGGGSGVLPGGAAFVGVAVGTDGGVFVGVAVAFGGCVFVGVAVSLGGCVFGGGGVDVGAGVLVGRGVFVGAEVGGGDDPPLKVALTDWSPFMVTNVILVELSSVPVHDSQT